jgi:hypothetical protein
MNNNPEESHQPRLDPFVFPSETTIRFALLIISIISASLFIYNFFYWGYRQTQIDFEPHQIQNLLETCTSQAQAAQNRIFDGAIVTVEASKEAAKALQTVQDTLNKCVKPARQEILNSQLFSIGGVGILMSLASLLYSFFPVLIIWKEGLISLDKQADMEDINAYLQGLCQEIGIRPPRFLQKPISRAIGGRAFGALGRYYVVLPTGLLLLFDRDRNKFRAVMCDFWHNLAVRFV